MKLKQFRVREKLYYIVALKSQRLRGAVLAFGWNQNGREVNKLNPLSGEDIQHPIATALGLDKLLIRVTVHNSIYNCFNTCSAVLTGLDAVSSYPDDVTTILSSPHIDFSSDVNIVLSCKSSEIIQQCKDLGLWED